MINWHHVYPLKDDKPHDTDSLNCKCNPTIDWNNNIVIHNAWDFREVKEELEEI